MDQQETKRTAKHQFYTTALPLAWWPMAAIKLGPYSFKGHKAEALW
jgi:hypothetical protein